MVLPYLRFALTASTFEMFCEVADVHEYAALGARGFFGVGFANTLTLSLTLFSGGIAIALADFAAGFFTLRHPNFTAPVSRFRIAHTTLARF
jgi:hypothetical protein